MRFHLFVLYEQPYRNSFETTKYNNSRNSNNSRPSGRSLYLAPFRFKNAFPTIQTVKAHQLSPKLQLLAVILSKLLVLLS